MTSPVADLYAPFPFQDVEYRIGASTERNGGNAMLLFYVDARVVMDRLDAYAASVGGTWYDSYAPLADGIHIECQLTVEMPGPDGHLRPVTRCDVGEPSEGMGDKVKGAYSSALKRAAVKFGVGRGLYSLGEKWVPCEFVQGQGKPRPKLTQKSHDEARRFYIDAVGVAAEPQERARTQATEPPDAPAGTPARAPAPPSSGLQQPPDGTGAGARGARVNYTTFYAAVRDITGCSISEAKHEAERACKRLDLPVDVLHVDAGQAEAVLAELRRGVPAPA